MRSENDYPLIAPADGTPDLAAAVALWNEGLQQSPALAQEATEAMLGNPYNVENTDLLETFFRRTIALLSASENGKYITFPDIVDEYADGDARHAAYLQQFQHGKTSEEREAARRAIAISYLGKVSRAAAIYANTQQNDTSVA